MGTAGGVADITVTVQVCARYPAHAGRCCILFGLYSGGAVCEVPDSMERTPVDVCCVIDISASMSTLATYEVRQGEWTVRFADGGWDRTVV